MFLFCLIFFTFSITPQLHQFSKNCGVPVKYMYTCTAVLWSTCISLCRLWLFGSSIPAPVTGPTGFFSQKVIWFFTYLDRWEVAEPELPKRIIWKRGTDKPGAVTSHNWYMASWKVNNHIWKMSLKNYLRTYKRTSLIYIVVLREQKHMSDGLWPRKPSPGLHGSNFFSFLRNISRWW
jgi:hypothetical protein